MEKLYVNIDNLIEIVANGGSVRTGIDVYNKSGALLLEKNVIINKVSSLLIVKKYGLRRIPIDVEEKGGLWDKQLKEIRLDSPTKEDNSNIYEDSLNKLEIGRRIKEIYELKKEASIKYQNAKNNIKKIITSIKETGGEFDTHLLQETVSDVFNFMTKSETAFSYITKEIFSYDDYLYNHSIDVCTIGTAVLKKFNDHFSELINKQVFNFSFQTSELSKNDLPETSFMFYLPEELYDISIGFFLHDVGKVLIPDDILNKKGRLTDEEFDMVKTHTFEKGIQILEKNKLYNTVIKNIICYHHSPLFMGETNCYPDTKIPIEIPPYVKVCKLADIYDAMTTKRSYKEALNPVGVVTELFRKYADKDRMLQFVLHSFVKVVGIYPTGSVVHLTNGQMAYILDSKGPIILPFTDNREVTLNKLEHPVNVEDEIAKKKNLVIDRRRSIVSPIEVYDKLPKILQQSI
ncbi:MAG: HD domain-containing protein [Desulfobacterales bacterium]|nr:HD domain-containing protein [Desulfobacterales bacterium]